MTPGAARGAWALVALAALGLSGCGDRCAELDRRLCRDLGEDCAAWRASGAGAPAGEPDALGCDITLSDETYYANALREARARARR